VENATAPLWKNKQKPHNGGAFGDCQKVCYPRKEIGVNFNLPD